MEYTIYAHIGPKEWSATILHPDQTISISGSENQSSPDRNEIQSMLEILQFLRNWMTDASSFVIYVNSQYCISCMNSWIPQWIQKGFRISNTATMRPNTDLLVKLHSFGTCMNFELVQHYNDYETYRTYYPEIEV